MTGENDQQRRVRLIAQRELPGHAEPPPRGIEELAALVASQRELQRRVDAWIEAATASGREVGERIGGLERIGRLAITETRRSTSDVAKRLHAVIADERVRRAEHDRMMADYTRQATEFERARRGIEALAASQARWVLAACTSAVATLVLAIALGWHAVAG